MPQRLPSPTRDAQGDNARPSKRQCTMSNDSDAMDISSGEEPDDTRPVSSNPTSNYTWLKTKDGGTANRRQSTPLDDNEPDASTSNPARTLDKAGSQTHNEHDGIFMGGQTPPHDDQPGPPASTPPQSPSSHRPLDTTGGDGNTVQLDNGDEGPICMGGGTVLDEHTALIDQMNKERDAERRALEAAGAQPTETATQKAVREQKERFYKLVQSLERSMTDNDAFAGPLRECMETSRTEQWPCDCPPDKIPRCSK